MATATADAALASAAAGTASAGGAAPSAPASTGAGGGAGDAGGALLTDDQILGISEGAGDTSHDAGGASGAATAAATASPAATAGQGTARAAGGQAAPAELTVDQFKPLFGIEIPVTDAKGAVIGKIPGAQIQCLWDKFDGLNKVVTQFGTVAQAREAAGTIQAIGGVKELASLAAKAAGVDELDATFFGGTPEGRRAMVNEWYDGEGPQEFAVTSKAVYDNLNAALEVMAQRDKPRHDEFFDRVTRQALDGIRHGDYLAALARARESGENIEQAVDALLQHAGHFGLMKTARKAESPEARQLAARKAELDARDANFSNSQAQASLHAADMEIGAQLDAEIEAAFSALKVNGRPVFQAKSKVRTKVAKEVRDEVDAMLKTNPVFIAQFSGYRAKGVAGKEKELAELTMRHARLLLPKAIEKIVGEWTESVVSHAQGAAERANQGASRTEVAGAGTSSGGTRKQPFTSDELKSKGGYGNLSDDDILNS